MPISEKHKLAVQKVKDYFLKKGYECAENVNVIRNKKDKKDLINSGVGKIDICCQKDNSLFCAEIESSGKQVIKNKRDLEQMEKIAKSKGLRYKGCQIADDENFREVCK